MTLEIVPSKKLKRKSETQFQIGLFQEYKFEVKHDWGFWTLDTRILKRENLKKKKRDLP